MTARFPDIARVAVEDTPASRLRTALDLFPDGVDLIRQRLIRENPGWDVERVERALLRHLANRGLETWGPGFTVKCP